MTELRIAQVLTSIVADDGSEQVALVDAFDANIGMDLAFAPGGLGVTLAPPAAGAVTVAILADPLGVNEVTLETAILPALVAELLPDLAGSLASFPILDFLGLSLGGVEVSKNGAFLSLVASLTSAP